MGEFISGDFLLSTEYSRQLYHEFAADLPIIDFHNHLSPQHLAGNHRFEHLTELWLAGDHYKWRAMRANGIDEKYISGSASAWDKFHHWARTVPFTLGNPLYHWTHLELKRYFGLDQLLDENSAKEIYHHCNHSLASEGFGARDLVMRQKVEVLCTTDDPVDGLEFHRELAATTASLRVLPTFRPDRLWDLSHGYRDYISRLSDVSGQTIGKFHQLLDACRQRIDFFHQQGCRLSDHGINYFPWREGDESACEQVFAKALSGVPIQEEEKELFQITLLLFLAQQYADKGWVQQFHLGAIRNNRSRLFQELGADAGCDSMGDWRHIQPLGWFLDSLDAKGKLAKTIIYNSNPVDNAAFATMMANFNESPHPAKMQYGASWWFLDQYHGMVKHLQDVANFGLLPRFVGMVTDSRSFLSFTRHEYFRRILCDELGKDIATGKLPHDLDLVGKMIGDICYHNAKNYFNF